MTTTPSWRRCCSARSNSWMPRSPGSPRGSRSRSRLSPKPAASTLTAFSFFQLTYSVQARGYATATLALLIAYGELERALDAPRSGARWTLALAAGIGFFSHLAMGPVIALLGMISFAETLRRRNAVLALRETFALFWPTALATAPTIAFVIAGYRNMGGFTIGHLTPFAASRAIGGIATTQMTP